MKVILDLCGGTGAWSKPYADAGYTVINVTLPHIDVRFYRPPNEVYGILAAPPCDQFSIARTTARLPRNFRQGMETVEACLRIIWECRFSNKLAFWALENPQGLLRQFLGLPAYQFQPYEFGHHYSKKTDIWGYFNKPKKGPVVSLDQTRILQTKQNLRDLPPIPEGYVIPDGVRKQKVARSITPAGFAKAFYKANN